MVMSIESIKYSLRNLSSRKGRSSLTIFSIFIGIVTIFIFISFGLGLYYYVDDLSSGSSMDKIVIQPKGGGMPGLDDTFKLTDKDLRVIEDTPGIDRVTGMIFKVAEIVQGDKKVYTFVIGFDPEEPMMFDLSDIEIIKGRYLKKGEKGKVLAGYNYMVKNKIFPKAYELNDKIEIQGEELRIVGFFNSVGSPPDDAQLYVTNEQLNELYPGNNSYGWIMANVKDVEQIDEVMDRVEKKLRQSRGLEEGKEDFFIQSFQDLIETYAGALNMVIGFVVLIALISVLVSAVNTANTMITSVLERYKEIGIMKAVGSTNSEIFKIFLFESSFLGFLAGGLGVFVGWAISSGVGAFLVSIGWGFLSPAFPKELFIGLILFATVTGAISGMIPAWRASKTNIVDAIRYE